MALQSGSSLSRISKQEHVSALHPAQDPRISPASNRGGTMIKGVKFASIPVIDQDRALAFYTEKLGFRLLTDQPFSEEQRWIELGIPGADTRVVLFKFDESLKPGSQMNITFWADDVEATARELKSKGVQFIMEPKREEWGTAAAFKDVDGNTFVLSSK
jgi:catechol 2,3-dioxygenase-like lactoylglutathione lyase family enzyme